MADDPIFGKVISRYTTEEAEEDGFIHKLFGNDRITENALQKLKAYYSKHGYQKYTEMDFIKFFANEVMILAPFAKKMEYQQGKTMVTNYQFKVGNYKHSQILFIRPNELGGVTLMTPEDN